MSTKTAVIAGATGLIGNELLQQLLSNPDYAIVRILIRRPLSIEHPKLEKRLVDFTDADSLLIELTNADVLFCAVGTTNKKVKGDKVAYRKVDYDIPVRLAQLCKMTGCKTFVLVSAIGANAKSSNFYLQLKGEAEEAVKETGLESIHIMQPSILLGNRKEKRPAEKTGQLLMQLFSFLLPSRFKPIQ
ncbi:MAG: NAD(P)H-binding protein, partial [Bacteroidetes bacterium]|nr:NAD(P)H-binding protein [Bacteroidota bacterium]